LLVERVSEIINLFSSLDRIKGDKKILKNLVNSIQDSMNPRSRAKVISAIVIALFLASAVLAAFPVKAQEISHGGNPTTPNWSYKSIPSGVTPDLTVYPESFLSVSPNPIGKNEPLLVNMWLTFPSAENRFCADYTVTITLPDGSKDTRILQSYVADGTSYFIYNVTQVGTYTFQMTFPGEWFPAGNYSQGQLLTTTVSGATNYPYTEWYNATTTPVTTVTVLDQQVNSWYSPLPTGYWTRPIEPNNREWNVIGGNFPWGESKTSGQTAQESAKDEYFGPYIPAVKSPHIVWSAVSQLAGIIGGETGVYAQNGSPSSTGSANTPSVIYMGRGYTTVTKVESQLVNGTYRQLPETVAECYDIQTGKVIYDIPVADGGVTPTHITYWAGAVSTVPGEAADTTFTVDLNTISGGRFYRINANTGAVTVNQSMPTFTDAELFYRDGYYLSYQTVGTAHFLVNWTEQGGSSTSAWTSRIVSNISVTIPPSYRAYAASSGYGDIGAYDPVTGITVVQSRFLYGNVYGYNLVAVDLNNASATVGQVLWNVTSAQSDMASAYRPTNAWCRDGLYMAEMERGSIQAWHLNGPNAGKVAWTDSDPGQDYPWGEFWMYDEAAYSNLIFAVGYTGVWAIDENTGTTAWHYVDPAIAFETPYASNGTADYSVQDIRVIGSDLNGGAYVYVTDNEHTPSQPATRGWGLICLNATSGDFQWKIMGSNLVVSSASDGYMFTGASYDGSMYVMGKGLSSTTVSAPQTALAVGSPIVISGSVMDQSPAQPNTPAISDATMDTWMDYLHFQMPIGGIYGNATVTGVPVTIYVTDPNGNTNAVATVTSDISGTYAYTWTPPATVGNYKITATFGGSNSYSSSYAETYATVVAAPTTAPTAAPTNNSGLATTTDLMTYIVVGVIAMIIALAIATVLILRKH
jgi:hypothetical protein